MNSEREQFCIRFEPSPYFIRRDFNFLKDIRRKLSAALVDAEDGRQWFVGFLDKTLYVFVDGVAGDRYEAESQPGVARNGVRLLSSEEAGLQEVFVTPVDVNFREDDIPLIGSGDVLGRSLRINLELHERPVVTYHVRLNDRADVIEVGIFVEGI